MKHPFKVGQVIFTYIPRSGVFKEYVIVKIGTKYGHASWRPSDSRFHIKFDLLTRLSVDFPNSRIWLSREERMAEAAANEAWAKFKIDIRERAKAPTTLEDLAKARTLLGLD